MRKKLIKGIFFVSACFGFVAASVAQVEHVSINSRQFELNNSPQLKVNIVAHNYDVSRLIFYITQVVDGEYTQQKLKARTITPFLLQLNGTETINDKNAHLVIAEFTPSKLVTLIDEAVFDAPYSLNSNMPDANTNKRSELVRDTLIKEDPAALPNAPSSDKKSVTKSRANCLIERDNSDTLWRIANRHKQQWNTSVYGAMLAIFEANLAAFSKQRINLLLKDVPLVCPSIAILAQYNDIKVDRKVFEVIEGDHAEH